MLKPIAIGLMLALLVALPTAAQDYKQGKAAAKRGDYAGALKEWLPLAERGHAQAQYKLASMYRRGLGVKRDYGEAGKWYRKAADQGHAWAQLQLGRLYYRGRGVTKDPVAAHMWFSLAVARGLKAGTRGHDRVAKKMTPAQIAEAQKLAQAWRAKKKKKKKEKK
jgi:TPR repeat protein